MALLTDGQSIIDAEGPGAAALKALGWRAATGSAEAKLVTNAVAARGLNIPELEVDTGLLDTSHVVNPTAEVDGAGEREGEDAGELKGEALDAALRDAGLPTTGKADEKRARLAEHYAG